MRKGGSRGAKKAGAAMVFFFDIRGGGIGNERKSLQLLTGEVGVRLIRRLSRARWPRGPRIALAPIGCVGSVLRARWWAHASLPAEEIAFLCFTSPPAVVVHSPPGPNPIPSSSPRRRPDPPAQPRRLSLSPFQTGSGSSHDKPLDLLRVGRRYEMRRLPRCQRCRYAPLGPFPSSATCLAVVMNPPVAADSLRDARDDKIGRADAGSGTAAIPVAEQDVQEACERRWYLRLRRLLLFFWSARHPVEPCGGGRNGGSGRRADLGCGVQPDCRTRHDSGGLCRRGDRTEERDGDEATATTMTA
nr:unnamed protein product [Digitaria exilis]